MKWSTTVSLALAAGGLLALLALVSHERNASAGAFLLSIEKRYAEGKLHREQMLRELELARAQAELEGQHELALRAQLERGKLLLELGSFASARSELAAVASEAGPRRDLELLRIELELRASDAAAGLVLARSWLRTHPGDARAHALCGELLRIEAAAPRDEALESCSRELVNEPAQRAAVCVRELSARPASDPRRVALARDLRALYGTRLESSAERVLGLCDRSAGSAALAREALGHSLELAFDADTLALFAELLEEAGLGEEALDLALAASRRPELLASERGTSFLLHALVQRGRWRYATEVAEAWIQSHPASPAFLLDACRASYGVLGTPNPNAVQLHRWASALNQRGSAALVNTSNFYLGQAFYSLKSREMLEYAYMHLSLYTHEEGREPLPGARALALRQLAECCRTLGKGDGEERSVLESAVEFEPLGPGESWLRLAELQLAAPRGGFRGPDLRWARGMALLPGRNAELLPRWLEIGASELRTLGIDPRGLQQDVQNGIAVRPSSGAAPFELHAIARAYIEAGRAAEAQALIEQLELAVPNFLPALDLRVTLAQKRNQPRELAEAFLTRLEQAGYDERSRALRAALPADALSPADLRRIVHADPDSSGRLEIARSYARRGDARTALRFVLQVAAERLGPKEQLFAAGLELETGAAEAAFTRLYALGPDLAREPGAVELWIDAGMRADKAAELRERAPATLAQLEPERARFLALADRLLLDGEPALARGVLQRLDMAGKRFRGGDVLWRLAAASQALGQPEAVDRLLERASAFDTQGEVELLELLALPAEADLDTRRMAVQVLRQAGWKSGPLGQAALARLAGDPALEGPALESLKKLAADDPLIAVLEDPATDATQARAAAELVLALERPALGSWLRARLDALAGELDPTWPLWIEARLARRAGEREIEERELRALLKLEPHFTPAWDRLVELRTRPEDEGECELDLRLERAAALGESAGTPAERDWDRSRRLEREGAFEEALAAARSAAIAAPDSGPILRHLGRLSAAAGRIPLALNAYKHALTLLPVSSRARSTAEFLALLESARSSQPAKFDAEAERAELEALAALRPDDPRVLLAQARNDLETSGTDPAFGAERAASRLEHFRGQHEHTSFEDLAPGSTEGWTRFLLALDPARAREFLDSELELDPGNLEAWALLPRCTAAEGREEAAIGEVALVQRLAPGAEGLSEYMRLRARGDWSPEGIALVLERLRHQDESAGTSPATLAIALRGYLNLGPRGVQKALQLGTALAPAKIAAQPAALRAEIFWMHAVALLAHGSGDDLQQARLRTTVLDTLVREPARRPLVAALKGLAQAPSAAP